MIKSISIILTFIMTFTLQKSENINNVYIDLNKLIISTKDEGVLKLSPNQKYIVKPIEILKKIKIIGNNAEIKGTLPNTGISFGENFQLKNVILNGVWVSAKTTNVNNALISGCSFINQNFSNIVISNGAENVKINNCIFKGKATGTKTQKGVFPCVQITTASKNIIFENNICKNVISGITANGIDKLIDNIIVRNNHFEQLTYYALKVDAGNNFLFSNNTIKEAKYGVFNVSLGEDGNYSPKSGKGLVVENNLMIDVENGLYNVGTQNQHSVQFINNKLINCSYGVRRSNMNLKIFNNYFENGISLYDNFETTTEGNIDIAYNLICNTNKIKNPNLDWDKETIQGALVFAPVARKGKVSIKINGNIFKNIDGRIINIPRIGWTKDKYIVINLSNNQYINSKEIYLGVGEIHVLSDEISLDNIKLNKNKAFIKVQ